MIPRTAVLPVTHTLCVALLLCKKQECVTLLARFSTYLEKAVLAIFVQFRDINALDLQANSRFLLLDLL